MRSIAWLEPQLDPQGKAKLVPIELIDALSSWIPPQHLSALFLDHPYIRSLAREPRS